VHTTERTQRAQRRRVAKAGLTTIILGGVLAVTGFVSTPAGAAGNDHQITICHATSSQSNPYTSPSPAKWQITAPNGHGWDTSDIIPPFDGGSKGNKSWDAFPGLNWDAEGQAIYAQGCNALAAPAGSVTLDKVTAGDGQPAGTTGFDFTVSCSNQAVNVPDTTPTLTPEAAAAPVASGLAVGDACTIDESAGDKAAAASTTFSVNGGAGQAGPVVVALESPDQVISVVVTNTYACPNGQVADGEGGCTTPTTVTDVCPQAGVQTSLTECPVEVQGEVLTPSTPSTPAAGPAAQPTVAQPQANAVQGAQIATVAAEELPRTGSSTTAMAEIGLGLILLGVGALLFDRKQTVTV
jgi:LPXTG-motif cell wall-anchored protein